jgi:MFS family permease
MFSSLFLVGVVTYGTLNFRAAFFQRTYHWSPQAYGLTNGIASLIASPFGLIAGTWLCERWNRRYDDANMRVGLLANALAVPFVVAGPLMPNPWLATFCSAAASGVLLMAAPPTVAAMQSVTPSNVRAQVNSIYLLLFSGITGILGPWFIGWLTDLQHDETKLRYVMVAASAVMLPIAVAIFAFSLKPFGRMIAQIKAEEAAGRG